MSIRDIIEAVATTAEAVRAGSDRGTEGANRRQAAWIAAQEFIATFDPEHVALMEAVCKAAQEAMDDGLTPRAAAQGWCRVNVEPMYVVLNALQAYRKTHGYGD